MKGLVLCSHGTRSALGAARVSGLVAAVAGALPSADVREAHVDVHPPYVDDVLRATDVVVPLLLAPGYHVGTDIASAAERVGAFVTPALGPDELLTWMLAARLGDLGRRDVVVLAAAGSSVPGSAHAVRRQALLLERRLGRTVHVAYGASSDPLLPDVVRRLRAEEPGRRVVAASYLLAPGHFHDRVLTSGVDAATAPLLDTERPDPLLVELVVRRYLDVWLSDAV